MPILDIAMFHHIRLGIATCMPKQHATVSHGGNHPIISDLKRSQLPKPSNQS
jgi:hypothetical protein